MTNNLRLRDVVRLKDHSNPFVVIKISGLIALLEDGFGNRREAEVKHLMPWPRSMKRG